jgi:hypothetical protein
MTDDLPPLDPPPVVAAVTMGYGHLRAAVSISDALGVSVARADRAPLATWLERRVWAAARAGYHGLSRVSQERRLGPVCRGALDRLTAIEDRTAGSPSPAAVVALNGLVRLGLGAELGRRLDAAGAPLVATFYAIALAAARHSRVPVACVVTDSDIHRVWAPAEPRASRIRYLVPVAATADRLLGYGVARRRISVTGFPLPPELVGGDDLGVLRTNLATRWARLGRSDSPLHVVIAIGGAGTHADRALAAARELEGELAAGRVRLTLAAGTREEVADRFRRGIAAGLSKAAGRAVAVLCEPRFEAASRRFTEALAGADALWTKPSELVFYGALGLPLILEPAVGDHEHRNRELVVSPGIAADRPEPGTVVRWLDRRRREGWFVEAAARGPEQLEPRGAGAIAAFVSSELYERFTGV